MTQMKVFEFAKEIGIETISLMDKIRQWRLPVKSHMATLDQPLMDEIRAKLSEELAAKAVKSKTTKRVSVKKASAEPVPKAAKTVEDSVVTKVTAAQPATEKPAKAKAKAKTTTSVKKVAAKKAPGVIRRKAGEVATPAASEEGSAFIQDETEMSSDAAQATTTAESAETHAASANTATGVQPAEAKRRNIVGRMDLSRARVPVGGAAGGLQDRSGMRTPVTSPRNIRTGFFAQGPIVEQPPNFEEEKQREEKRKRPGAGGKEEEVQIFNASDFRKREVIFQPKKKKVAVGRDVKKTLLTTPKASKRIIHVEKAMSVAQLAAAMGVKAPALIKKLMSEGVTANINTDLDFDTIALIVPEFNFEAENVYRTVEQQLNEAAFGELDSELITRPPVVTVMGHVDHGKTSLLDAIRQTNVASGEAGGITQHIGAYKVRLENGKEITFLDTPGHEAFTAMRARGANVTDIAIIVVAADDGVMPQTVEAISHAKAAEVPIIIVVNKIDKPGADVNRIKQQLTEQEIVPEEWGGSNIFCEVSALKKTGVHELLEQILLVAEVEDLKANPKRSGTGIIIESRLEKGRGAVATILIRDGHFSIGDNIVAGVAAGRVRAMTNDRGETVETAQPGDPVEVLGLPEAVSAGERIDVVQDEDIAREIALARRAELETPKATGKAAVSLEELFAKIQEGQAQEFNVILKADVAGSVEALREMLHKASTAEVKVKIIHSQVGGVTESDILLASTSGAVILGFNVRPDTPAMRMAKELHVDVRTYTIIYELLDDVKKAMAGKLQPITKEVAKGRAEVREVFSVPKVGNIAGCAVADGKITRSDQCRVIRDGAIIYQGKFASLRRFKDDVREVATGFECGIGIENFNDIKVGDTIEAYVVEQVAPTT